MKKEQEPEQEKKRKQQKKNSLITNKTALECFKEELDDLKKNGIKIEPQTYVVSPRIYKLLNEYEEEVNDIREATVMVIKEGVQLISGCSNKVLKANMQRLTQAGVLEEVAKAIILRYQKKTRLSNTTQA